MNIKNHIWSEDISTSHNLDELEQDTLLLQDQIKSECNSCYRQVLEHMRPEQIVQGIKWFRFDTMSWTQIQKHTARPLMVQLCTNILWERTKIDSDHGKRTKQDVKDIQKKLKIKVDGDAGKDFFSAVVAYIQSNSVQTSPQKNEQQGAKTKPVEPLPPRKSENIKSNESDKRTLDTLWWIREDLAEVCIQLFPKLENVHPDREKVTPQIARFIKKYQQESRLTSNFLDRRIHLIYNENPRFTDNRSSYTDVGQVSKDGRKDWYSKWLWIQDYPTYVSQSMQPDDIYSMIWASMWYFKRAVELAKGDFEKATAIYNLWPEGIKTFSNLSNQALKILKNILRNHNIQFISSRQKFAREKYDLTQTQLNKNDKSKAWRKANNRYSKEYKTYIKHLIDNNIYDFDQNLVAQAEWEFYRWNIEA